MSFPLVIGKAGAAALERFLFGRAPPGMEVIKAERALRKAFEGTVLELDRVDAPGGHCFIGPRLACFEDRISFHMAFSASRQRLQRG